MNCPNCYTPSAVSKTIDAGNAILRNRRCVACGSMWVTEETLRGGSLRSLAVQVRPVMATAGRKRPPPSMDSTPSAGSSAGGVGGGLSSGIDPSGVRSSDPSLQSSRDLPRARDPFKSRPVVHVGAATPPFMRIYRRYPNPHRMQQAAQVWQVLAQAHAGGEDGLEAEIGSAFDAGFLLRHPYSSDLRHRPKFEDFLAEQRWLEPAPAPDPMEAPRLAETLQQRDARALREGAERRDAELAEVRRKSREAEQAAAEKLRASGGAA